MSAELRRQLEEIETDLIVTVDALHVIRGRLHQVRRQLPPATPSDGRRAGGP